jgi:hypothetical protein
MYQRWVLAGLLAIASCSSSDRKQGALVPTAPGKPASSAKDCVNDPIVVFDGGREGERVCAAPAKATVVDLHDEWAPTLFAVQPDGTAPEYRATYVAAAREEDVNGKKLPASLGLSELYGVLPSFAIVRERFTQTARYACRAKVDSSAIAKIARPYGQELDALVRFNNRQRELLGKVLERARLQRNAADYSTFESDKELGGTYARWKTADELYSGIVAAQRHLVCEGYLEDTAVDGEFTWVFGQALEHFQRRNFLIPNGRLDPETRSALAADPRELDYRFALRVLRERVVDATGLIEDGTAGDGPQPIMGRVLDPDAMRRVNGHPKALANAAPDLVSAATEAAARQLGWTDADATAAFLAKHPGGMRVAVELPALPSYYSAHMDLSAEIDRGDVWYDEKPVPRVAWKRPAMILYVQDGATKRPLVRWPTTIGGWSDVRLKGALAKRWKESDVGPREWRAIYAAPTWLPPPATPDQELVRWAGKGKWTLKTTIMGPGPLSAFGMVRLAHERPVKAKGGATQWIDNGIGTHGSASVTSLLNGTSHGCHRLYNHMAIRLGAFLLHHRNHEVKGMQPERYRRVVKAGGSTFTAKIDTRGFLFELTPPVHVEVLPGNIRSPRKIPPLASVAAGAE